MRDVLPMFLLMLGAAGTHTFIRMTDPPPIREVVEWKALGDLGEPPYRHEVLLNLTATWCAPCREMKLTTFRDPEFTSLLRDLAIVPVRIEDQGASPSPEFEDAMSRYGVRSVPALVWLSVEGTPKRIIRGVKSTAEVRWMIESQLERAPEILWRGPRDRNHPRDQLEIRLFDKWFVLGRESRGWLRAPEPKFAAWANETFVFVSDDFGSRGLSETREYYREYGVRHVPTMLVTVNGREIARFEGSLAIDGAPGELRRIAAGEGR